ncbi:MAG TPA: SRPBCC family protein [Acidimicrobiales bacterium]|nr:SRPBCC family protein [Acidimicrobiales bacterium]
MASVSTVLDSPPERVWSLLEDPGILSVVIPGAHRIRRFDAHWPDVGTRVHHTIGVPPLLLRDSTVVLSAEAPRRLRLLGQARPFGTVEVEMRLTPHTGGTEFRVEEWAASGPISARPLRPATDLLLAARNKELCRRLSRLIRRRNASA